MACPSCFATLLCVGDAVYPWPQIGCYSCTFPQGKPCHCLHGNPLYASCSHKPLPCWQPRWFCVALLLVLVLQVCERWRFCCTALAAMDTQYQWNSFLFFQTSFCRNRGKQHARVEVNAVDPRTQGALVIEQGTNSTAICSSLSTNCLFFHRPSLVARVHRSSVSSVPTWKFWLLVHHHQEAWTSMARRYFLRVEWYTYLQSLQPTLRC